MNKLTSLVTVSAALILIFAVTNVYASQPNLKGWDRSYGASEIIGSRVKNLQGENTRKSQRPCF